MESDESRRFAGEIEKLNDYLKPIKSDARIYDLLKKGFFGREWLFEAVENWRNPYTPLPQERFSQNTNAVIPADAGIQALSGALAPRNTQSQQPLAEDRAGFKGNSRLFWITGDPGVGKSAFAAQLTHTHPAAVIAAQFVEWDKPDHRDARRVVRSLAFQLATRLPRLPQAPCLPCRRLPNSTAKTRPNSSITCLPIR